jgi:hypothetical protein
MGVRMDTPTMIAVGMAGALGAYLATRMQSRKNKTLIPAIETALRAQGALTLPGLGDTLGMKGVMARGKIVMALNEMVANGKVRVIQAPDGTPQLQKVNFIKYELTT